MCAYMYIMCTYMHICVCIYMYMCVWVYYYPMERKGETKQI